jgi:hypothetical protein
MADLLDRHGIEEPQLDQPGVVRLFALQLGEGGHQQVIDRLARRALSGGKRTD